MCVIIYIPKGETISTEELKDAWTTNPHGAGYSYQKDNRVNFKRGFMKFDDYYNEIKDLIGDYNLILHFRISTSKSVNKVQTHPYKKGNVIVTEGSTKKPVICMNGIISGQKTYKDCNDTMSYIVDHQEAFASINQDILNIIENATGAKWAVMTPENVLLSSKFVERNGRFYSNTNHLWSSWVYRDYYNYGGYTRKQQKTLHGLIKDKKLIKSIKDDPDKELYEDLLDFVEYWCNGTQGQCNLCTKCLKTAKTLRDIKIILNENYYYDYYTIDDDEDLYNKLDYENMCSLDLLFD